MVTFLVVFGTGEGQTAKVAERIESSLTDRGHDVSTFDVDGFPDDTSVDEFDAVVVVGSSSHIDSEGGSPRL